MDSYRDESGYLTEVRKARPSQPENRRKKHVKWNYMKNVKNMKNDIVTSHVAAQDTLLAC